MNFFHLFLFSKVSFGSTSPALSDRSEFPLFYRTVAPDSSHNPARIAFIRRFGWDTVTTFSQNEEIHSLAVNDLVTELENANISCTATTFAETDFKNQLKILRVRWHHQHTFYSLAFFWRSSFIISILYHRYIFYTRTHQQIDYKLRNEWKRAMPWGNDCFFFSLSLSVIGFNKMVPRVDHSFKWLNWMIKLLLSLYK